MKPQSQKQQRRLQKIKAKMKLFYLFGTALTLAIAASGYLNLS